MSDAMFHQHAVSTAQAVSRPGLLVDPTGHDQTKLLFFLMNPDDMAISQQQSRWFRFCAFKLAPRQQQ